MVRELMEEKRGKTGKWEGKWDSGNKFEYFAKTSTRGFRGEAGTQRDGSV
jgi:hypothetical protein